MSTSIRQETTRRIVDAALAVFSNVDFHQATIREIARRAGIAQATIYKHFESKEHLLHSIVAVKLEEMTQGLEESLLGVSGVLAKLRKMTWYILRFYETNPDLAWVLYVTTPPKSWIGSEGVQIGQRQAKILRGILIGGANVWRRGPQYRCSFGSPDVFWRFAPYRHAMAYDRSVVQHS